MMMAINGVTNTLTKVNRTRFPTSFRVSGMSDGMSLQPELKNPFVVRIKKKIITAKQNIMNN